MDAPAIGALALSPWYAVREEIVNVLSTVSSAVTTYVRRVGDTPGKVRGAGVCGSQS
jgi:hypothetical protein